MVLLRAISLFSTLSLFTMTISFLFCAIRVILQLTKRTLLIVPIIYAWVGIAWPTLKYDEIARANDAPVRIQPGFFPEEITGGPQMDLRHIEFVLSDALVRLFVNARYSCAVLPCRWIELIPRGEKSRALRLSHEALTFANYSQYEARLYVIDIESAFTDEMFGDFCRMINFSRFAI